MRLVIAALASLPLAACVGVFQDEISERCEGLDDEERTECIEMLQSERQYREQQGPPPEPII